jgi:FkbM family methyltransferase
MFREIFLDNCYEFTEFTKVQLAENSKVYFLDLGANIGLATFRMKRKFPKLKVVCFEASPVNYALLERNLLDNHQQSIKLVNAFLGDDESKFLFRHYHKKPGSSLGIKNTTKKLQDSTHSDFEISSQKLSSFLHDGSNYVLKIDIEGGEYSVLQELLSTNSVSLILEIIAEVTIASVEQLKSLVNIIEEYEEAGFQYRILSDYNGKHLVKRQHQGHLMLSLFR